MNLSSTFRRLLHCCGNDHLVLQEAKGQVEGTPEQSKVQAKPDTARTATGPFTTAATSVWQAMKSKL